MSRPSPIKFYRNGSLLGHIDSNLGWSHQPTTAELAYNRVKDALEGVKEVDGSKVPEKFNKAFTTAQDIATNDDWDQIEFGNLTFTREELEYTASR